MEILVVVLVIGLAVQSSRVSSSQLKADRLRALLIESVRPDAHLCPHASMVVADTDQVKWGIGRLLDLMGKIPEHVFNVDRREDWLWLRREWLGTLSGDQLEGTVEMTEDDQAITGILQMRGAPPSEFKRQVNIINSCLRDRRFEQYRELYKAYEAESHRVLQRNKPILARESLNDDDLEAWPDRPEPPCSTCRLPEHLRADGL